MAVAPLPAPTLPARAGCPQEPRQAPGLRRELRMLSGRYIHSYKYINTESPELHREELKGRTFVPGTAQALPNSARPGAEGWRTLGTAPSVFPRPRLEWTMGKTTVQNCKRRSE